jgi:hypothetical protein
MTFILVYMTVLVFQTFWGIATMRDNRWGTRDATVDTTDVDVDGMTVLDAHAPVDPSEPSRGTSPKEHEFADIAAAVFAATAATTEALVRR